MSFIDSDKIDVKKLDDEFIEPIINKSKFWRNCVTNVIFIYKPLSKI